MRYQFGRYLFDTHNAQLSGPDGNISLRPMTVLVLRHLLENAQRLVGHEELLDSVWGRQAVSIGVLSQSIRELRQALGDSARNSSYIETKHKLGYRFLIQPQVLEDADGTEPNPARGAGDPDPIAVVSAGRSSARDLPRGRGIIATVAAITFAAIVFAGWWLSRSAVNQSEHANDLSGNEILHDGRPREPEAAGWYWQGIEALRRADLRRSIALFEQVLKREPESVAAMAALADALAQSGDLKSARPWASEAMKRSAVLPRSSQLRLEAFAAGLDYRRDDEVATLQALYRLDPGDGDAGLRLVSALTDAGRITEAVGVLDDLSGRSLPSLDRSRLALAKARLASIRGNQSDRLVAAAQAAQLAGNPNAKTSALLEQARAELLLGHLAKVREILVAVDDTLKDAPWPAAAQGRQMILATLLREEGKFDASIAAFEEAARDAEVLGNRSAAIAASREAGYVMIWSGHAAEAVVRLESLRGELELLGNPREMASLLDALSVAQQHAGLADAAQASASRALQAYLDADDHAGEAGARNNLGMLLARTGRPADAQEQWEKALQLFVRAGNSRGQATSLSNLAILYARAGRLQAAGEANQAALEAFRDAHATLDVARLQFNLGVQDRRAGRLADAESRFRESLEGFVAMGAEDFRLQVVASLGELLLLRVDLAAADLLLGSVEPDSSAAPQRRAAIETARARLAALRGQNETAKAGFRSAKSLRSEAGLSDWVRMSDLDLAELAARQGSLQAAEQSARESRRDMLEANDANAAVQAGVLLAGTLSAQGRVEQAGRVLDDLEHELVQHADALLSLRVDLLRASLRQDSKSAALLHVASKAREAGFDLLALRAELLADGPESDLARAELDRRGVRVDGMPPPIPY
jgi:DNA-binding winged helix-turn-helix (wHTH) protein/tetratricopeptide (TPR) repeat protein